MGLWHGDCWGRKVVVGGIESERSSVFDDGLASDRSVHACGDACKVEVFLKDAKTMNRPIINIGNPNNAKYTPNMSTNVPIASRNSPK